MYIIKTMAKLFIHCWPIANMSFWLSELRTIIRTVLTYCVSMPY